MGILTSIMDTGENAELLALQRIDETCMQLQQKVRRCSCAPHWHGVLDGVDQGVVMGGRCPLTVVVTDLIFRALFVSGLPLSCLDQGKYLEALECMERGLVLRQHFFGADSDEVWRACKTVGEMCNLLAMTYLQQGDRMRTPYLCALRMRCLVC